MTRRKQNPGYECPIEVALDVIGGKWKGMVLHRLLDGPARFSELARLTPGATHRVLTLQLRELERDGVISRTVFPEVPPRVEYRLTELGNSLRSIFGLLSEWGDRYSTRAGSGSSAGPVACSEESPTRSHERSNIARRSD